MEKIINFKSNIKLVFQQHQFTLMRPHVFQLLLTLSLSPIYCQEISYTHCSSKT